VAGCSLSYCHLSLGGPLVLVPLEDVSCVCSSVYHRVGLLSFHAFLRGALRCRHVCVWYH
jgi:hypothetical protein